MSRDFLTSAFKRLHARLLSRATAVIGSDDAADALQEAFYRLWKADSTFNRECDAEGMLTRTVYNITIDSYRRSRRFTGMPPDTLAPPGDIENQELLNEVNALIDSCLNDRDRQILLHRDRDGWEFDEIAEFYGVTEANARMIVSRARNTIRTLYRKKI